MTKEVVKIPGRTRKELKQLAVDIVEDRVFTDWHLEDQPDLLNFVFMPLSLGAMEKVKDVGLIYEYYEKASPRSINGCPIFMSMYLLNNKDTEWVLKLATKLAQERQAFLEKGE